MKKLYTLVCLLVAAMAANAQFDSSYIVIDSSQTGTVQKWLRVFEQIPTDSAHTGYFIDRTPWLQHPTQYTGLKLDATNSPLPDTTFFETLTNLHFGLKRSQVDSTEQTLFDSTEQLVATAIALATDSILPIAAMRLRYNTLGVQAFADTLLYYDEVDSCFKPTPYTYASPFDEKELFAAAPIVSELYAGNYRLQLPPALMLNNTGDSLVSVKFKLDNADEYTMIDYPHLPFDVNWTALEGQHFLHLAFLFSNGVWYFTISPIFFKKQPVPYTGLYANGGTVVDFAAVPGQHAGAKVTVRYGCGKTHLTKPLIIVEGFDPPEIEEFNFQGTLDMLRGNLTITGRLQELESQGYDLVYIDHKNGSDSIERNVRLFKEVVAWCNAQKAANGSTEKNAVLGISMGGLIARMGLREMELQNTPHQTEVYISLDAPHRGAYVPLSFQFMLADAKKLIDEKLIFRITGRSLITGISFDTLDIAVKVAQSPAAKQLQLNNIFDQYYDCTVLPCLNIVSPTYKAFHHKYDSLGPPQLTSNFAIVSGSISGQRQHDKNGMMIPDGAFYASHQQTWFNMNLTVAIDYVCPRGFGYSSNAESEFILNAQHNVPNQLIYKSNVRFKLTNHRCAFVNDLVDIHPIRRWVNSNVNTLARDNAPGGYLSTSEYESISVNLVKAGINFIDNIPDKFTFVPTYSALDATTNDIYYDFSSSSNSSFIIVDTPNQYLLYFPKNNNSSTFDVVSAPNRQSQDRKDWNESHAKPSMHSGLSLFAALMAWVGILQSDSVPSKIHQISYNYGKITQNNSQTITTSNYIAGDLFITNGNTIFINGEAPLGFTNSMFGVPDINSQFNLYTRGAVCNQRVDVTVDQSSGLILGSQQNNRSGVLEVLDNSTLTLNSNSYLELNNQSVVRMRWGSKLVIEPGAIISLQDNESHIEFEPNSTIEFKNGSTFTFTGAGYLLFRGGLINNQVKFEGAGAIQISGNGKHDKKVEFKKYDNTNNHSIVPISVTNFTIQNAKIVTDCILQINTEANLNNIEIVSNSVPGNIFFNNSITAQNVDVLAHNTYLNGNSHITGGRFKGTCYATNIFNNNDELYMDGTVFNELDSRGLQVYNSRNTLKNLVFVSQHEPMVFEAMTFPTTLEKVLVHNHSSVGFPVSGGNGIYYGGTSSAPLHLNRTSVLQQSANGVFVENAQLSLECSKVTGNQFTTTPYSIILNNGASLVLDPSIVGNAGRSDLNGYRNTILCNDAFDVQINNGHSNLASSTDDAFVGNLTSHYTPGVDQFLAANNYWKSGTAPTRLSHYYRFVDGAARQFGINGNVIIDGSVHYNSIPNLINLCPSNGNEGGGGNQSKANVTALSHPILSDIRVKEMYPESQIDLHLNQVFNNQNNDNFKGFESGIYLLESFFGLSNKVAADIQLLIYRKTIEHLGHMLSKKELSYGKPNGILDRLENVQVSMLNHNNLSKIESFNVQMDKIFLQRAKGELTEALKTLAQIAASYPNKFEYVSKWECIIQNELDLQNDVIDIVLFLERTKACKKQYASDVVKSDPYPKVRNQTEHAITFSGLTSKVFPNPAKNILNVDVLGLQSEDISLQIVDISGRLLDVHIPRPVDGIIIIDVSALSSGVYFFKSNITELNQKFTLVK